MPARIQPAREVQQECSASNVTLLDSEPNGNFVSSKGFTLFPDFSPALFAGI